MTALEQQLTTALRALSSQYEQAQQQQAMQVEAWLQQVDTLGRQVAQLDGQVTHLALDYRTLAATLRGRSTWCARRTGSAGRSGTFARACCRSRESA